ncbi:GAF domain-containing protein [Arthrobacter echini]|uniref:GAF domain-containing protein n=1 Tax=Arthrobacter echini TaxID=1529066 RepID=A0A5D0XR34_9MICC|nr:GAF domain-containing protein [Arthrobacter echini]
MHCLPSERTFLPLPLQHATPIPSVPRGSSVAARAKERQRLRAVDRTRLLDSGDEERFDRLTRLAQQSFGVLSAVISLIGDDRQFLKSFVGPLPRNVAREFSVCDTTLQAEGGLVVPDLGSDARFRDNPFVVGPPFVRFYAGLPLRGPGGWFVGSMCILDTEPRILGLEDRTLLQCLAQEAELELNRGT